MSGIRTIAGAVSMLLLFIEATAASPIGPVAPKRTRTSIGFEFAAEERDLRAINVTADIRESERLSGLIRVNYGLSNDVELSVRFGKSSFRYTDLVDVNASETKLDATEEFAWGGQIGAIVYRAPAWNIAGIANFLAHSSHSGNWPGRGLTELDYREWSFGLQAQGRFQRLTPYIGIKYSDASIDFELPAGTADDEAEDKIGIYLGAGIDLNPRWTSYIEGHFADETSFGAGVRYTY